jgi:hypothetical protein
VLVTKPGGQTDDAARDTRVVDGLLTGLAAVPVEER